MIESVVTHEIPDVTPEMLRGVERGLVKIRNRGLQALKTNAPVGNGVGWYTHRSKKMGGVYGYTRRGHMRDENIGARKRGLEVTFLGEYVARFVNDGTSPHIIPVRGPRGTVRKVRHPGSKANPFFDKTLNSPEFERGCIDLLDAEVTKAL